jgi:hypothetical protein
MAALNGRDNPMNDETIDLDQADEDILTDTVSDEGLEAAGGSDAACCTLTSYYRYSAAQQNSVRQSPDILTYDVPDEALEAAAGMEMGGSGGWTICWGPSGGCR